MSNTWNPPAPPDVRPLIGREHLLIALLRLAQPERELLGLHLRGEDLPCIARRLALSPAAARRRLRDVLARTRDLAAHVAHVAPHAA